MIVFAPVLCFVFSLLCVALLEDAKEEEEEDFDINNNNNNNNIVIT